MLQREILRVLSVIARKGTLTVSRRRYHITGAMAYDLAEKVFGEQYSRSQWVSLNRALKSLARLGHLRLFYVEAPSRSGIILRVLVASEWKTGHN